MSEPTESGGFEIKTDISKPSKVGDLIKLSDAAGLLGCHIETLRKRVRRGRLQARRGPHGAYYVTESALAQMRPLTRWPAPRRFEPVELEPSWDLVEGLLGPARATRAQELAMIEAARADPAAHLPLFRLVSVQRLREVGLTYEEIGLELGISARHARRLDRRSIFLRLRGALFRDTEATRRVARQQARVIIGDLRQRLEAAGFRHHRQSDKARSQLDHPLRADAERPPAFRVWDLASAEVSTLRSGGLSDEQIKAIQLIGIGADELNHLLLFGLPDS